MIAKNYAQFKINYNMKNVTLNQFVNYLNSNNILSINCNSSPDYIISAKSGIKIKKENRGKFTEYCGGKVTSECITRGKNSPDPKIRKRATFAQNARGWNKKDGGILFQLEDINLTTKQFLESFKDKGIILMKKGGKKWIQKAVNPKHKGYCTPMTKSTCTPRRKALAKRFKKMAKNR